MYNGESKRSVAILSSASGGGAGIAAKRIQEAFCESDNLTANFIDGETLGEMVPVDVAAHRSYSNRTISDTHYTVEQPGFCRGWLVDMLTSYDVVNVHWASFLVGLAELDAISRAGKPMIFTLHDFYYVTGGCHYPATCTNLSSGCYGCPQLDRTSCNSSQIPRNLRVKQEIFSRPNVHLMAPSKFLVDAAIKSGIVPASRGHVMRNAYRPLMPATTTPASDAPIRIVLIADSLSEGRKQMLLALQSLVALVDSYDGAGPDIFVDVVGKSNPYLEEVLQAGNVPHAIHGRITDHAELSQILVNGDMLVTCSNEDNWPNVLVEAGAYGCMPIVGPGHGCEEFVRFYKFGQVAADYTVGAFVTALRDGISKRTSEQSAAAAAAIRSDHAPETAAGRFTEILGLIEDGNQKENPITKQHSPEVFLPAQ